MAFLASHERRQFTVEEYLVLERSSSYRSEYVDGEIYAMSGSSLAHDILTVTISGLLFGQLRGRPCQVLSSNMKVRSQSKGLFSYPDVTVVCGNPLFHDDQRDVLINSKVIFEVLSPSTEGFDRGRKRLMYQSLDSLTDYVLVSQDEVLVEHWVRQSGDDWLVHTRKSREARLDLPSIECSLALVDVYERLTPAD